MPESAWLQDEPRWICGTPFVGSYEREHPSSSPDDPDNERNLDDWELGFARSIRDYFAAKVRIPEWRNQASLDALDDEDPRR